VFPPSELGVPQRPIRFCGADCGRCETCQRFLAGHEGGLVSPEMGYRCCWLPADYPAGRDCAIRPCCEGKSVWFCGECAQFDQYARMHAFYAQPG